MSKIIILFLSVVFLSAAGSCDGAYSDWPEEQQKQYSKLLGLQIIDTAQTFQMINCQKHTACRLQELNPLLGSHQLNYPSTSWFLVFLLKFAELYLIHTI